ncbi:MAG: hypothetical protein JWR63_1191, partial [Conexibacter sp.]|nr:hypothetical protein [Conexibacter sp.]
ETIRAFFTSMNPDLKDQAAIEVVRSGKAGEVYHAIDAFIEA